jgi:hypothetical protein
MIANPDIRPWIAGNPIFAIGIAVLLFLFIYLITRLIFGRGLIYIAARTKNSYDDIIVKKLRPSGIRFCKCFPILTEYFQNAPKIFLSKLIY